jgi:serine/threonine protein kinase/Tol biopolymer transport system component
MECPEPVLIAGLVNGMSRSPDLEALESHLNDCSRCANVAARAVTTSWASRRSASDAPPRQLTPEAAPEPTTPMVRGGVGLIPPGTQLGRYRVLRWLGRGGMGEVYEGYDPELDRRVALKLLRTHSNEDATAQRRLSREARTLARLHSPNVVAALDVGVFGGQLFLVMELVEGPTLASWLLLKPRDWREVLDMFLGAGEGVAAAHQVDVIHRDFKPQNVLIGADGKPRVSDFGLARETDDVLVPAETDPAADPEPEPDGRAANATGTETLSVTGAAPPLTRTGMVIGTPRYMAPEQFLRRPLDARVDQFSFCVALYEALYGDHPFTSQPSTTGGRLANLRRRRSTPAVPVPAAPVESLETLRTAVLGGRPIPTPRDARVPHAIAAVLRRGLARDPDDRFPTLSELLSALRRAARVRGRRLVAAAAAVVLLAAGGAAVGVSSWYARDPKIVQPVGVPEDWTNTRVVTQMADTIHCVRPVDEHTLRLIWGAPRRAEDLDIDTRARRSTNLDPASYRHGCPSLSPDGRALLFEGYDADGRPHIFHADNPTGAGAKPLVSSAEPTWSSQPLWLSSGSAFAFDLDLYHPAVFDMQTNVLTVLSDRERLGSDSGAGFFKGVARDSDGTDLLAITESTGDRRTLVNLYRWPGLKHETAFTTVATPSTGWIPGPGRSLWGGGLSVSGEGLGRFDLGHQKLFHAATIPGREIAHLSSTGDRLSFATRSYTATVWYRPPAGGETALLKEASVGYVTASMTSRGDVLLTRARGARYSVVLYRLADRTLQQLTDGPDDYTASALPNGEWVLGRMEGSGHARPGIFLCSDPYLKQPIDCRRLTSEFALELSASPSGRYLAYTAGEGHGSVLRLMSLRDGSTSTIVRSANACHPVWSSDSTVWTSVRNGGELSWIEFDVDQRRPTGRSRPGTTACFDGQSDPVAPVTGPVRIESKTAWDVRVQPLQRVLARAP